MRHSMERQRATENPLSGSRLSVLRKQLNQCLWVAALALATGSPAFSASPQAPDASFTTVDGQTVSIERLKGRPTMLWLLSTWCGSCAAGLKTLAGNVRALEKSGLRVVVLRNYKNGGYPGADIGTFVSRVVPDFEVPDGWMIGQASKQLDHAYNGRHYPDVYFLIDARGRIQEVASAPSATMDRILRFARGQHSGSPQ